MSLRRRRSVLWLSMRLRHPVAFAIAKLAFAVWMRYDLLDYYDGVALVDSTLRGRHRDLFLSSVHEALDLIRALDPRRYRMVCTHLTAIVADDLVGQYGHYEPFTRTCSVDLEWHGLQWPGHSRPWAVARLAATIVHEATHGRLFDAGFGYNHETRAMVERLCTMQARAFSERLCQAHPEFTHLVAPPFHARNWSWAWHAGVWERGRRQWWRLKYADRRR